MIGVIDTEGCFFDNSYYAYEVSLVIFDEAHAKGYPVLRYALHFLLNYDIRDVAKPNYAQIKYVSKHFGAPFATKHCVTDKIDSSTAREFILKLCGRHKISLYAKGPRAEEVWLLHPDKCNGNKSRTKINSSAIIELADFNIPKYDTIDTEFKRKIITYYMEGSSRYMLNQAKLESLIQSLEISLANAVALVHTNVPKVAQDYQKHIPLYECIIFGYMFLTNITRVSILLTKNKD